MIALCIERDTNVLIYACDKADPLRQQVALDLVSSQSVRPQASLNLAAAFRSNL